MDRRSHVRQTNGNGAGHCRPATAYQATVRSFSDRLVEALRPIRVLDAVKWDDGVEEAFFANGCRALPPISRDYYATRPLAFDPVQKGEEFLGLARDVRLQLGGRNPAGRLLLRRCGEGRALADLVARRGTPSFASLSRVLYGSTADCCRDGGPPLANLGRKLSAMLERRPPAAALDDGPELTAADAVRVLAVCLADFFKDVKPLHVRLSDGIVADAAAGSDYIKVRQGARFTRQEVRLLEVHEGWVHLGTTLNGQAQPICTFLTKGTPSTTVTQEGLAVLTEVLAAASHPARVQRLLRRIEAVGLAEAGANFLDVYRFFLARGYDARDAYQHTVRVFRGSLPEACGPFTKDLSYGKGFLLLTEFVRQAVRDGNLARVPLLFCGKTSVAETADLAELAEEGLLLPPRHLPPPFADLGALAARLLPGGCLSS